MDERVHPAEAVYEQQMRAAGDPHFQPPVMEELKEEARARGLWNLFHPDPEYGPGLTNAEYAPLAEIMRPQPHRARRRATAPRRTPATWRCSRSSAPTEQKDRWLRPLLDGEIRSAFAMTEPDVACSDATNIQLRIERDGDEYVLNGRKWWTSGAHARALPDLHRDGQDRSRTARTYKQQSMILVPLDTPGRDGRAQPAGVRLPSTPRATPRCASRTCACPRRT